MGDADFLNRMQDIPSGAIVLIEDVDAAFVSRDYEPSSTTNKKKSTVSFSALLNAIDGVGASEGRILIITTNHVDRLDKALIRPGRTDLRFSFGDAIASQARELFLRWYMPRDRFVAEVQLQADAFAASIPEGRISVAALQGYLLTCGDDYNKALRGIADWVKEQE